MLTPKNGSLLFAGVVLVVGCGSSSGGNTGSSPGAGGSDSAGAGGSTAAMGGSSAAGTTGTGGSGVGPGGSGPGTGGSGPGTGGSGTAAAGGVGGSAAGGAAAGGSSGGASASSSIMGSFMGMPFNTAATALWIGMPDSAATEVVYIFSAPVDCSILGAPAWDAKIPNNTQVLEMKVFGTAPATFTVVKSATPKSGEASVNHSLSKTTPPSIETAGSGGTVTVATVNAGNDIVGSFAIHFGADMLTGTFDATFCAGGVEP